MANGNTLSTATFIRKSIEKHGNKYDYSLSDYTGRKHQVLIICPTHGKFNQVADYHLSGHGCAQCGGNQKMTTELFIKRAVDKHGGIYSYNLVVYNGKDSSVKIICQRHGVFLQNASNHLNGKGCKKCADLKMRSSTKEYIKKANLVHGSKYQYLEEHTNSSTKIRISCPTHGIFIQRSGAHLSGRGCPECASSGFDFTRPAILYYLLDIKTGLYKIGITNREVVDRFGKQKMKEIKIIKTWTFKNGRDAYDREQSYHTQFSDQRINNENFRDVGGFTEFFEGDVLSLDK